MKLLLGKVLIETDHIEIVEKVAMHTVKIVFVSGNTLEVHCAINSSFTCGLGSRCRRIHPTQSRIQILQNFSRETQRDNLFLLR